MNKLSKILFLADANSNHTRKWVEKFVENDYQVVVFSLYPIVDNWDVVNKIKVHSFFKDNRVTLTKKIKYFSAITALKKTINNQQPDIIYAHYASSYGLLGALTKKNKFYVNFLGSDIFVFPKKGWIFKKIIKYVLKKSDAIFSSSKIMTQEIKQYTPKKVITIPFGVDLQQYKPKTKHLLPLRNKQVISLGIVKSLAPIYCLDIAIQAVKILNQENKNYSFQLSICGDGVLRNNLEQISSENISFKGKIPQDEVPIFLNSLDIYLNPTQFESFGVSTIEAMACGVPVIAFDAGGSAEIITHETNGILYSPNTPERLSQAILNLVNQEDKYEKIRINARKTIEEKYNLNKNTKELLRYF